MKKLDIRDYGGCGDGYFKNTRIIQECIDQCSEDGGTVYIGGKGRYVCGTIYLKSNVTLRVEAPAVLLASPDIQDYGDDTHYNRYRNETSMDRCWIYACDAENITLCGTGTLDGNADAFPNEGSVYRPMMLRFLRCRNLRLRELYLYNSPAWTTAFLDSEHIWIDGVRVENHKRNNGDGLDFDGCRNVFVRDCDLQGTDDNLCLQSGSREYNTEYIHISGCKFSSLCAAVRIGLKSVGTIRNVTITNCTMENVWREGIKIECTEGGEIAEILVQNISMKNVSRPVYVLLNNRFEPEGFGNSTGLEEMPRIGTLRHLIFSGITAVDTEEMRNPHYRGKELMGAPWFNGIRVDAEEEHKIENMTLRDIRYYSAGGIKKSDIPQNYPRVVDKRKFPHIRGSENHYPDWSRTAFMDIRNVEKLYVENVMFGCMYPDEREPYLLEGNSILRQEIFLEHKKSKQTEQE